MEEIKFTPKEEVDPGANNMGLEYESKVTLLTSLAACLCFEEFEVKTNVNGYTPLDDICLSVKQGNEEMLYLFQLKHVANPTELKNSYFIKYNIGSKARFDLDKYCNKYMELYKKLKKNIFFIFYTNYTLCPENKKINLFIENDENVGKFFNMINTSSSNSNSNYTRKHLLKNYHKNIKDYDIEFINNSYFFMNQEHNDNILDKFILKLLGYFGISDDLCKLIIDDLLICFNNFCKIVENKPILTKTLLLRILYYSCFYCRSYSFNEFKIFNSEEKCYPPHLWRFIKNNKVIIKRQYKENIKNMIFNDEVALTTSDENDVYFNIIFKHSKSKHVQIMNYFIACCRGRMPFLIKIKYYNEIGNILNQFDKFQVIFIAKNDSIAISKITNADNILLEEIYNLEISLENRNMCFIKDILDDKDDLKTVLDNVDISDFLNIYDTNQHEIINNERIIKLDRFIYKIIVDKSVLVNLDNDLLIILNFTHQKKELFNYINLNKEYYSLILEESELSKYDYIIKVIISKNDHIDFKLNDYNRSRNIHYFRFENDYLSWRGTIGKTDHLNNLIKIDVNKTLSLTETLSYFKYNKLLVFSGVPGIGKSISMRQISKIIPPRVFVVLINLREKEEILNTLINDKDISCLHILRKFLNEQNSFYLNIFEIKFVKNNILVILDGYDEIAPKFVKITNKIIHNILDENIKVILTTRSVLQKQVEEEFSTKSLILKSFDITEQKEFLEKYFSKNINDLNCNIHDICENTIDKIKNNEIGDVSFNSVPLHLQIISDILLDLLKQTKFEFSNIKIDKLQIYEIFIAKKLGILMEKTKVINIDEYEIKTYHQNFSLKQIFSNIKFEDNIVASINMFSDKLRRGAEKTGILIDDVNDIFIHRTIAEYFTATWLIDNFEDNNFCRNILLNEIVKREYFIIYDFFNSLLFKNESVSCKLVLNKFNEITDEEILKVYKLKRNILHLLFLNINQNEKAKQIDNRVGLFLKNILLENHEMLKQKDNFELFPIDYAKKLAESNELIITIKFENLNMFFHFNQAFNLLEFLTCTNIKIINSELKFESGIDILIFGFNRNFLNQVNFIFLFKNDDTLELNSNKLNCYEKGFDWLLFDCKENIDYLHRIAMNVKSLTLSKYLLTKNYNISSWKDNENSPIHYACEHMLVEFIKFFMENGAKLEEKNSMGFNCFDILTKHDSLMSFKTIFERNGLFLEQFNKFIKYLIVNENKKYLNYLLENNCNLKELKIYNQLKNDSEKLLIFVYFLRQEIHNEEGNTILHLIVLDEKRQFSNQEVYNKNVLCIFKNLIEVNYDINIKNLEGLSPLHLAVTNNIDIQLISFLIENKANIEGINHDGDTPLLLAVRNQNLELVNLLLEGKANIEATNNDGRTPLIEAVLEENLELIKILLENKANIEAVDTTYGRTPLIQAVIIQNLDLVKLLLENKANIEAVDSLGRTPLIEAVVIQNLNLVKLLLKNKANIEAVFHDDRTPLICAVIDENLDLVKLLFENKANIEAVSNSGNTPLISAVISENLDLVKLLLENKANIEAVSNSGNTPLISAVISENLDLVKLLLENKANIEAVSNSGNTPLISAVISENLDLVKLLLENKANIEAVSNSGNTPLISAVCKQNLDLVKLLLENKANIEADGTFNGTTPLMFAVILQNLDLVKLLLENKANIEAIFPNGRTPLIQAVTIQNLDLVKLLLENKANIETVSLDGRTPLISAVLRKNLELVKILLENKANIEAANKNGKTPLKEAVAQENLELVKLLLNFGSKIGKLNKYNVKKNTEIYKLLISYSKSNTN